MTTTEVKRRVILLDTDERAGLVASIADTCAERNVSLEITTGPGHVIISFSADDQALDQLTDAFRNIPGVNAVHPYAVASA
jgi:hypothetical protein